MAKNSNILGKSITMALNTDAEKVEAYAGTEQPPPALDAITIQFDPRKVKAPFSFPGIPPEFYSHIGMIAVLWGEIETILDGMIEGCLKATQAGEEQWKRQNFKKRRRLFLDLCDVCFAQHPAITTYYKDALDKASNIMWKRNVLVHGHYLGGIRRNEDGSVTKTLYATGFVGSQRKELNLEIGDIEDIYYELAHICGLLAVPTVPKAPIDPLSSQDINFLREFLENNHPHPPIENKPRYQPQS